MDLWTEDRRKRKKVKVEKCGWNFRKIIVERGRSKEKEEEEEGK